MFGSSGGYEHAQQVWNRDRGRAYLHSLDAMTIVPQGLLGRCALLGAVLAVAHHDARKSEMRFLDKVRAAAAESRVDRVPWHHDHVVCAFTQAGARHWFGTLRVLLCRSTTLKQCLAQVVREETAEYQSHQLHGVSRPVAHLEHELLCVMKPPENPRYPRLVKIDRAVKVSHLHVRLTQ